MYYSVVSVKINDTVVKKLHPGETTSNQISCLPCLLQIEAESCCFVWFWSGFQYSLRGEIIHRFLETRVLHVISVLLKAYESLCLILSAATAFLMVFWCYTSQIVIFPLVRLWHKENHNLTENTSNLVLIWLLPHKDLYLCSGFFLRL